jgi:hypothetical protein
VRAVIVGCGETKRDYPGSPMVLYQGSVWRTLRQALREIPEEFRPAVFAYSGKHGLISALETLEPYEHRGTISTQCHADLRGVTTIHATVGVRYIGPLRETLNRAGFTGDLLHEPGRGIGDQRANLRRFIRECGLRDKRKPVYLCGPINARSDAECRDWRETAKALLEPFPTLDPMRRDYRGMEETGDNVRSIVERDIADIATCRALLVMYDKPSVGTAMEIRLAKAEYGTPVHVVDISGAPRSPWLIYHATAFYDTLEEACAVLRGEAG